jgi:hypothetical protein
MMNYFRTMISIMLLVVLSVFCRGGSLGMISAELGDHGMAMEHSSEMDHMTAGTHQEPHQDHACCTGDEIDPMTLSLAHTEFLSTLLLPVFLAVYAFVLTLSAYPLVSPLLYARILYDQWYKRTFGRGIGTNTYIALFAQGILHTKIF